MKISLVVAEFFHVDRQTDRQRDMTKLIVVFRNFGNEPKNSTCNDFSFQYFQISDRALLSWTFLRLLLVILLTVVVL
jgi:hypothetical protein